MPDSFFVSQKTRKRKRPSKQPSSSQKVSKKSVGKGPTSNRQPSQAKSKRRDEELDSDATQDEGGGIEDLDLRGSDVDPNESGEEDDTETPAEKRLRLAKIYLDSVKESLADGDYDAAEIDKELISSRLKQDVLEHSGKISHFIADALDLTKPPPTLRTRGHKLPVTHAVASADGKFLFTSGKEGSIIKWDLSSGKQLSIFRKIRPETSRKGKGKEKAFPPDVHGHTDEILSLALTDDGQYLASAGKDRMVVVWDVERGEWVKSFAGHRDTITALKFRKGSQQLYSASSDRTIKSFDLSVMGYVETLYGHQDSVVDIDALRGEVAVSVGARDKTVRYWKIVDETQLVFRGGGRSAMRDVLEGGLEGLDEETENPDKTGNSAEKKGGQGKKFIEGSLECVTMVDETTFVSGGDSGSICLWTTQKKKPQFIQPVAHGLHEVYSETEGIVATPRWITALGCLRYSDLIASGSWEGDIRLWKLNPKERTLSLIGTLSAPGFVNSLQIISPPNNIVESYAWTKPSSSRSSLSSEEDAAAQQDDDDDSESPIPLMNVHLEERPSRTSHSDHSLLIIAGMSKEPRLGRWMKLQGDGIVNGARIFCCAYSES